MRYRTHPKTGDKALEYSVIGDFAPQDASGKCVYCNHCKPCPVGLDIGLINKYYDLAKTGDVLAVDHYKTLEKNAADCIGYKSWHKRGRRVSSLKFQRLRLLDQFESHVLRQRRLLKYTVVFYCSFSVIKPPAMPV